MLEYIRNSAQSFGVKVAFGVIILVFVFWGVGNFNDRDYSNIVAMVNGEPIVASEFAKAYHNAEEYLLRQDPSLTREQLAKEHLGRQVLNELVQIALLSQEARRAGISVTPLEMRTAVGRNKAFQDESGKFDPDAYQRVLAAQRISPTEFERDLENQLLRDKIFELITAAIWVDPDEPRHRYNFIRERRLVDYRFLPAAGFMGEAVVTEEEARTWYEAHKQDFAIPPRVDVAYVMVRPEDLVDRKSIGAERAEKWYEANKSRFEEPERLKAAHILVPLPEGASEEEQKAANEKIGKARAELAGGKSFAETADALNPEGAAGKGGELGWIKRGQTVPAFEEAAFALEPGKVSEVVRTPFGLHLILVEEKKAAGLRPFKEVEGEVREALAFEDGSEKLHEALDNLIEDNILQKPLAESAAKYGLKAEESGLVDKQGLMEKLGVKAEGAEALLATPQGSPLDTALEAGDKYVVCRVLKSEPAGVKPFEEVKSALMETLKADKAEARAMAEARALLEKAKKTPFSAEEAKKLDLQTGVAVERGGALADFMPNTALNQAIFAAKPGAWLDNVYPAATAKGAGAILARVDRSLPPEEGEFASVAEIMNNGVKRERMDAIYEMFMRNLASKAKVEVTNPQLVDRVDM